MDPGLVARAREGDTQAFTALVAGVFDVLRRSAWLILRDAHAADDAVQEALLSAWLDLPRLREPDRFDAWMRRLLVRACADQARRNRALRVREIALLPVDGASTPDAAQVTGLRDELERGLRELTVEQRTVLVLTYYLDLSLADAAQALDIPIGTVKSRLDRARSALRAVLDAQQRRNALTQERYA
jgi:RNA polymerase sigma-70 factor (ECF subfamily)